MHYILHIESTSTICSVALSNGATLIAVKEINNGYTHAENLHVFIQELLSDAKLLSSQLVAISVSSGPGSYTGLRIGFSTAKGLAYALQIPLIVVDTLKALTLLALNKNPQDAYYCVMLDARRMEVYTAVYNNILNVETAPNALVLDADSILMFKDLKKTIYFFGDGMPKAKELLQTLPNIQFIENIVQSAESLIQLAYRQFQNKQFADVAYAEPFYLKDFFFAVSKK